MRVRDSCNKQPSSTSYPESDIHQIVNDGIQVFHCRTLEVFSASVKHHCTFPQTKAGILAVTLFSKFPVGGLKAALSVL